MTGKTISAYTDADAANRIEWIATREHRKKAQIAGSAVKLFVNLPEEAGTGSASWDRKTFSVYTLERTEVVTI